ncbi:MAG: hypothetical protein IKY78_00995 [Clostridia bacterium]|nr:hypothetical protein [Clostridia bacterium]
MGKTMKRVLCMALVMLLCVTSVPLANVKAVETNLIPDDAVEFNGHYYKVYEGCLSWEQAKTYCEEMGGHLVTITSSEENNFVSNLMNQKNKVRCWLGATDVEKQGEWRWITGEEFSYCNWLRGEPSSYTQYGIQEDYLGTYKNSNSWNDFPLGEPTMEGFICEWEPARPSYVPDDAVEFNGHYYKAYDISMSWTDAKAYCESLGGHLVTITTQDEKNFIEDKFLSTSPVKEFYMVGGYRADSYADWGWITGESFTVNNWGGTSDNENQHEENQHYNTSQNYIWITTKNYSWTNELYSWVSHDNYNTTDTVFHSRKAGFICEWEAQSSQSENFKVFINSVSNSIPVGSTVEIMVGYYDQETDELVTFGQDFAITLSDSEVVNIESGLIDIYYGRIYRITGLKEGFTKITFTQPETGEYCTIDFAVSSSKNGYNFDNVPKKTYEAGKVTNFYNYSGMVIDEFDYTIHEAADGTIDYYTVTMNVYNTLDLYGAVTSYDQYGNIYAYAVIDKFETMSTSFVESVEELWHSCKDLGSLIANKSFYSGESISKCTPIEIRVPANGRLSVSNNITSSPVVYLANHIGLLVESVKNYADYVSVVSVMQDSVPALVEVLTGEFIANGLMDELVDWIYAELGHANFTYKNIDDAMNAISYRSSAAGINFVEMIEANFAKMIESAALTILPTGWLINLLYAWNGTLGNTLLKESISRSNKNPTGINIYAPASPLKYQSNGISVSPVDMATNENIVVHTYRVYNTISLNVEGSIWGDTNNLRHFKYIPYEIAMYENGVEHQPDSIVEVAIPIPYEFRKSAISVYHLKEDGTVENMKAEVRGNYAVFYTNHFSCYVIVDETIEHDFIETIKIPATCSEKGSVTYACYCGDTYTETIEETSHTNSEWITDTAPTCTAEGSKHIECTVCGETIATETIPATSHTNSDWIIDTAPTCTTEGSKHIECTACGETVKTESIAKLPHNYNSVVTEATCEEDGYTTYTCSCGDTYTGDKTSATGHNYVEGICEACGESKVDNCNHLCHKTGFMGFIWKIVRFFCKLFGCQKVCDCGISHY